MFIKYRLTMKLLNEDGVRSLTSTITGQVRMGYEKITIGGVRTEMNQLFHKRIDIPEAEQITFESLGKVLEKTAKTFPF